jgi:hypothetical protein
MMLNPIDLAREKVVEPIKEGCISFFEGKKIQKDADHQFREVLTTLNFDTKDPVGQELREKFKEMKLFKGAIPAQDIMNVYQIGKKSSFENNLYKIDPTYYANEKEGPIYLHFKGVLKEGAKTLEQDLTKVHLKLEILQEQAELRNGPRKLTLDTLRFT